MTIIQAVPVRVTDLRKTFVAGGTTIKAANGLTLEFPGGSMTAVTGPSGSGKSTLLHLIGAIDRPDSGSILVGGTEITGLRRAALSGYRRGIGFVFQRYHLLPTLTALDNVIAPVVPFRTSYDKAARARELLDAVGLGDRGKSMPSQLSGGQQQRVAIARALMGLPSLLLADEPTGNLDSKTSAEILELLGKLRSEFQMTLIVATHEQHVASRADRLVRLRDGRVVDDIDLTVGEAADETLHRVVGLGS